MLCVGSYYLIHFNSKTVISLVPFSTSHSIPVSDGSDKRCVSATYWTGVGRRVQSHI